MPPVASEGLNRATLGKRYAGKPHVVDAESIRLFAEATNDPNPRYVDVARAGGVVAPPMYGVRLAKEAFFLPFLDPEVHCDILMLLHGEQEMRFFDLIHPGDRVTTQSEIAEIIDKDSGQVMIVKIACSRDGQAVTELSATVFIRARRPSEKKDRPKDKPAAAPEAAVVYTLEDRIAVRPDQSRLYARASLDDNPIHLDDHIARAAGLKGAVLQGLCTMAFCQRAIVNLACDGDPRGLQRLKVRFTKPVYPGDTITVQGHVLEENPGHKVLGFRAVNGQGQEVISGGVAEVKS